MRKGSSLRHQLVTAEQQTIFDYWASLCGEDGSLPSRHDLDPMRICAHLPFIALYEKGEDERFSVRLAGTGFWNFFRQEITGRQIDDLPMGTGCAYWNRVLSHVQATGLPMAGTTKPMTPVGGHLQQFWLRLPLAEDNLVLGFDQFLTAPNTAPTRLSASVFGEGAPLAIARPATGPQRRPALLPA